MSYGGMISFYLYRILFKVNKILCKRNGDSMRLILSLCIFALFSTIIFGGCGCGGAPDAAELESESQDDAYSGSTIMEVGEAYGAGGFGEQNQTMEQNRTEEQNMTQEQNRTRERNETGAGEGEQVRAEVESQGISQQVQEIISQRTNGSIAVPQGMMVRIIARNHTVSVENATFMLNETLRARLQISGQNRTLMLNPVADAVEITDENATVWTNETVEVANETLYVGKGRVLVMPSEIQEKIRVKNMTSARLHVEDGEPLYLVKATKAVKIFWLFDADMDVDVTLDAATGQVKEQKGPWWSIFASETD